MSTRTVLAFGGAAVGAFFGGPTGARIGFAIGSMVGGAVDPQVIKGPKLSDGSVQTSRDGQPIAIVYGRGPVVGTLVEVGPTKKIVKRKRQGKGGGPVTETERILKSFAILICENGGGAAGGIAITDPWKYLEDFGSGIDYSSPLLDDSGWPVAPGPFDSKPSEIAAGATAISTSPGYSIWLRAHISGTDATFVDVSMPFHDDYATYWWNGVQQGAADRHWPSGVSIAPADILADNVLAIRVFDIGLGRISAQCQVTTDGVSGASGITGIARVWEDDKLVYDPLTIPVESAKFMQNTRFLLGGEDQMPDPAIEAFRGVGTTPAFRGHAMMIRDQADITDQGARIPQYRFDVIASGISAVVGPSTDPIDPTWLTLPDMGGGYVTQEGEVIDFYLSRTETTAEAVSLGNIQRNLFARVNIASTKVDVTALTDSVRGFVLAKQMTCDDASKSLQTAYSYDIGDWDKKLRAVKRGGPVLYTITDDDLLDQDGFTDADRDQALDHPAKIHVFAYGPDYNYVPNKQTSPRYSPDFLGNSEVSIELPLVLSADEQMQAADRFMKVSDAESNGSIKLKLWNKFLFATVTDVFAYNGKRYRIDAINNQMGQVEIAEAKIDRQSAYTSDLTGIPAPTPVTPTPALAGPTLFAALNLPFLRTEDSVPGMYFAARGILAGWPGCDVQMSSDGGLSYSTLTQITNPAIIGVLTAAVTSSGEPLSVRLYGDDLSTITPGQLAAGGNAFAITSAGVSEIGQFLTATETSDLHFDLTGLVRGQLDTIAAAHLIDDQFVLLDAVVFVPIDASLIGQTLIFRPVTLGTIEDNNATYSVVYEGQEIIYDGGPP